MKKLKNTKKYNFLIIVTILIISMVSMLVYGIGNNNQFTISKEYEFGELEHGKTKDIKYTIIPNPIKFKDSVEKDVVLVLDTSQTVNQKQKAIKDSANQFVEKFLTDNNSKNFKLGIVSYNEKAEMVQELTKNKENLKTAIDNIYSDSNIYSWLTNGNHLGTNVGDAFRLAISMLGKDVDANKEKIVIFMSNGKPNAYTGKFYKGPESTISKEKISSLNRYEQRLYEITSLNGNEDGLGKESLSQEEVAMNNKIKDYEKYFYDPESLDDYRKQDFQKRGLRSDKVNNLIWNEYGISHANSYINEIYKGKSTYSVNVLPNKDDGENIISYYMGSEIGYAYSLKMAKEMKDLGISTYPIYFDNDGNSNNERNNDTRENTMKLISKFAGNEERNGVTSVNTVHSNDITASLNDVFTNLDKNIKDSYSVNDAKLTINIPEGLEIESINYSGKTIKINKEDLKDGKYQLPLNNLSYKLDERDRIYIYDGKPLEISVTVRGINTSGSDKNCSITGDVYSKSIEDSKKADLPNINIKVKSGIKVEITVNDFIGNVGEKYDSTYINPENNSFNFIKEPKRLIGDGNADISVNGIQEKSNEEYWIKTWFTKENSKEEINPEEFKLNNINSDIDLDKANNLTYQSYNVDNLQATGDMDKWNNRDIVFAKKQSKGILPSNIIATEPYVGFTKDNKNKAYLDINNDVKLTYEGKNLTYENSDDTYSIWSYQDRGIKKLYYYYENDKWYNSTSRFAWKVDAMNTRKYTFKHNTIFYDEMNIGKECALRYPGFQYKEADKYWGYIRPKESGWYLFGTYSDDGSRFSITKDGETYELSKSNFGLNNDRGYWYIGQENSNFKVHASSFYSSFTPIYLKEDKYYPIQLEYFNWGGGGSFKLGYCKLDDYEKNQNEKYTLKMLNKVSKDENYKSSNDVFYKEEHWDWINHYYTYNLQKRFNDYLNNIKFNWMGESKKGGFTLYPSKSNEPADIADEVFEGKSGVKFPKENGVYTIHYKIITREKGDEKPGKVINDNVQSGEYGKFEVKDLLDTSISVVGSNNQKEIYLNEEAKAVYKIIPNEIKAEDIIRDGRSFPKEIKLTEIKIDGMLPGGIKFDENNNPSINLGTEINGERKFSTDKLTDITYTLENGVYKGSELSKDVNVNIESNGPFQFKSSENKVGFKLNYEYKITNPMFEEFKGTSVSASEPTKIEKFGILDSASSDNIKDASEGVQVVNGIPLKIAILADVKSPNSIIDLGFNSQNIKLSKDTEPQFKIKIYNKGNLINCEKEFTIDKLEGSLIEGLNSGIKISGLDVGEKVIVIELIPNNIEINNSALLKTKVENSNDKEHLAKLDYAEMPDVF
ncbi:VWA domain-containing protein [Clostridium perfringens]|uniref:VWA domain-containing protein n=3 Tax=Clostridium perfringens TaxID=1502 RepID=UPI00232F2BF9|nr:VWA domain-containing protein [Clostridium perfringens]MDB2060623.1 VWA domain-containing protein [Clostridium perfringens]MDB2063709.1 VWA domain-containing protein [Clostridium perfringens]